MGKKTFKVPVGGINTLLGENTTPSSTASKQAARATVRDEPEDIRVTMILPEDLVERLKAAAYWQRIQIRQAVEEAIADYLKKHKPKPRPEEARKQEVAARTRRVEALRGRKGRVYTGEPSRLPKLPKY